MSIMEYSNYDFGYMFYYSERPGTLAARRYTDDVPLEVKKRRLSEIVALQGRLSRESNAKDLGKTFKVLVEGPSKKNPGEWMGRNSQNKVIVFPKPEGLRKGDYLHITVTDCTQATLIGNVSPAMN
jgi:tRNA-2-methylthio-N6-dimethylallyladenosine synthase